MFNTNSICLMLYNFNLFVDNVACAYFSSITGEVPNLGRVWRFLIIFSINIQHIALKFSIS